MKPVSTTAFYCCGIRMLDAQSNAPVCRDYLAARFIDDDAKKFIDKYQDLHRQNAGTVARHRIIDDMLRDALEANPSTRIIIVGAGFDTRAFRMNGGHWIELDEPDVMLLKEQRLPSTDAPNPLQRLPIDFDTDSLADSLAPYRNDRCIIILEGVVMYLDEKQLVQTAEVIHKILPQATVVADLMTHDFYRRYSRKLHNRFSQFGAGFRFSTQSPVDILKDIGFIPISTQSVMERAIEYGNFRMPRWLFRHFFKTLREGYTVWAMKAYGEELSKI